MKSKCGHDRFKGDKNCHICGHVYGDLKSQITKYKNKKVEQDGIKFDSKKELKRWNELILFEKSGLIRNLKRQVVYELIPSFEGQRGIKYIADFIYERKLFNQFANPPYLVVEDCKGYKTEVYKIKKKLMKYMLGIDINEV